MVARRFIRSRRIYRRFRCRGSCPPDRAVAVARLIALGSPANQKQEGGVSNRTTNYNWFMTKADWNLKAISGYVGANGIRGCQEGNYGIFTRKCSERLLLPVSTSASLPPGYSARSFSARSLSPRSRQRHPAKFMACG